MKNDNDVNISKKDKKMEDVKVKNKKWSLKKFAILFGILFFTYSFIGLVVIPFGGRYVINYFANKYLHRKVEVGGVNSNPYFFKFGLTNVTIFEKDNVTTFVSFDTLGLRVRPWRALFLRVDCVDIFLDKPYAKIILKSDGTLNFRDLLLLTHKDNAVKAADNQDKQFSLPISFENIAVNNGTFIFNDEEKNISHKITNLDISLPFVSLKKSDNGTAIDSKIDFMLDGIPVHASAEAQPFSELANFKSILKFKDLDLKKIWPYSEQSQLKLEAGKMNLDLSIFLSSNENSGLIVSVDVETALKDLLFVDTKKGSISLESLSFPAAKFVIGRSIKSGIITRFRGQFFGKNLTIKSANNQTIKLGYVTGIALNSDFTRKYKNESMVSSGKFIASDLFCIDNNEKIFSLSSIGAELTDFSTAKNILTLERIIFDKPFVKLDVLSNGKLGLADFFDKIKDSFTLNTPISNSTGKNITIDTSAKNITWTIALKQIAVNNGDIQYSPNINGKNTDIYLSKFSLTCPIITNTQKSIEIVINSIINRQGKISVTNKINLNSVVNLAGFGHLENLPLNIANQYLPSQMPSKINNGTIGLDAKWDISLTGNPKVNAQANITLLNPQFIENSRVFLKADIFQVSDLNISLEPNNLAISSVFAKGLFADIKRDIKGNVDIIRKFSGVDNQKNTTKGAKSVSKPFFSNLVIAKLVLNKGKLLWEDNNIKPAFKIGLSGLDMKLENIEPLNDKPINVDIKAILDGGAPLSFKGLISPFGKKMSINAKFNLDDYNMRPLSPYTGKYIGYTVKRGALSLDSDISLNGTLLSLQNIILLKKFDLGDAVISKDATSAPVKTGISLLKDLNGDIKLNLPVSGKVDDPSFSVSGVVFSALGGVFTSVVTAPFSIIGSIFAGKGDDADLSKIGFEPGNNILNEVQQARLKNMAESLQSHPNLHLTIMGISSLNTDTLGIKNLYLMKWLQIAEAKRMGKNAPKDTSQIQIDMNAPNFNVLLRDAYILSGVGKNLFGVAKSTGLPEQMKQEMLDSVKVKNSDLEELANKRGENVYQAFLKFGVPKKQMTLATIKILKGKESNENAHVVLSVTSK